MTCRQCQPMKKSLASPGCVAEATARPARRSRSQRQAKCKVTSSIAIGVWCVVCVVWYVVCCVLCVVRCILRTLQRTCKRSYPQPHVCLISISIPCSEDGAGAEANYTVWKVLAASCVAPWTHRKRRNTKAPATSQDRQSPARIWLLRSRKPWLIISIA